MNVNTLNNNNNVYDSVVLPPRMKDLAMWYTADYIGHATDSGNLTCSVMYDRSGKGNHLTQTTGEFQPFRGLSADTGQFGGKQVVKFTQAGGGAGRDETYIDNTDADVSSIFGLFTTEQVDPEWTIAMVTLSQSVSSTMCIFSIEENTVSTPDKLHLMTKSAGVGFEISGSSESDSDEGDQVYSTTAAQTTVATCVDIGDTMKFYQWVAGVANDWDDSTIGVDYPVDPETMFVDASNDNTITLGSIRNASSAWNGEIAELLMWDGVSNTAEITETLNYLRDKWDCT